MIHGAALGSAACESCHGARARHPEAERRRRTRGAVRVLPRQRGPRLQVERSCQRPRPRRPHGRHVPVVPRAVAWRGRHERSGLAGVPAENCGHLRQLPRESRLPGTAQDSVRASGRGVQAERPRTRPRRRQRAGGLVQRLSRQPCRSAGTRRRFEDQSLAGAGDMRDVSFEDPRRLCRKRARQGRRQRHAGRAGVHGLPRRARHPRAE